MKNFKEKAKELKVIEFQGTVYLGIMKGDSIVDAVSCGKKLDKNDISRWFRCYNLGDVYEEIKLVGSAGYTVRPFDVEEARQVDQCLLIMEDSKKLAQRQIENDFFLKNMKKNGNGKKNGNEEDDD